MQIMSNISKDDPKFHCEFYVRLGCSDIGSKKCGINRCDKLTKYRERVKNLRPSFRLKFFN